MIRPQVVPSTISRVAGYRWFVQFALLSRLFLNAIPSLPAPPLPPLPPFDAAGERRGHLLFLPWTFFWKLDLDRISPIPVARERRWSSTRKSSAGSLLSLRNGGLGLGNYARSDSNKVPRPRWFLVLDCDSLDRLIKAIGFIYIKSGEIRIEGVRFSLSLRVLQLCNWYPNIYNSNLSIKYYIYTYLLLKVFFRKWILPKYLFVILLNSVKSINFLKFHYMYVCVFKHNKTLVKPK